jgi:hypothetical protein
LYADVKINYDILNSLPTNDLLPFHIEYIQSQTEDDVLMSRYDDLTSFTMSTVHEQPPPDAEIAFQKVVISNIDGHVSSNELRVAVLAHIQKKGGYLQIPPEANPENEFVNPQLFPKLYPTLYPFGVGGPEDPRRQEPISFKRHIKHLLNLTDHRFQEHPSFLFIVFNIIQRQTLLLHTSLKTKRRNFLSVANTFAAASPDVIHRVLERVIRGDFKMAYDDEEC